MQAEFSSHTIAAIATAEGPAGVAVVRISGPASWQVAARVVQNPGIQLTDRPAGHFFHASFVAAGTGVILDDGLVLLFRAPASFTGEDVVELQGHGGQACSRAVLRAVLSAGARLAAPGEFTRRAFLNGRMDLTQAEAVMDLVQARSERAAQAARAQLDGALGREVDACYMKVTALCADVAAQLDFEEGELPARLRGEAEGRLDNVRDRVAQLLATSREGRLLRDGALVVISGCPNAGKSSLLNALLGTGRAIVSPVAGTTRDTIEEGLVLDGIPLRLMDTAGLCEASCVLEQEGVGRAHQALNQADLIIFMLDASRPLPLQQTALLSVWGRKAVPKLVVLNKTDLPNMLHESELVDFMHGDGCLMVPDTLRLSLLTGAGLSELKKTLVDKLGVERQAPGHVTVTERHGVELCLVEQALGRARTLLASDEASLVLAAGELRLAAEALGRITGRKYSFDLLDQIFARFCLGK